MMRLFIALPLPSEITIFLERLIKKLQENSDRSASIKWVKPDNIHLTVKFLGDTDPTKVDGIIEAMNLSMTGSLTINSTIDRMGAFPNLSRPRVIWAGLSGGIDQLTTLASRVDSAISELGFPREDRPFKAHLTLARIRDTRVRDTRVRDTRVRDTRVGDSRGMPQLVSFMKEFVFESVDICFDKILLFESTLTPRGPIYRSLHQVPLGQERFEG